MHHVLINDLPLTVPSHSTFQQVVLVSADHSQEINTVTNVINCWLNWRGHSIYSSCLAGSCALGSCTDAAISLHCYSAPVAGAEYCDQRVSVCLSVQSISLEPLDLSTWNSVCVSPVAVARSASGSVATCYLLPVLWMTSRLAIVSHIIPYEFITVKNCHFVMTCKSHH